VGKNASEAGARTGGARLILDDTSGNTQRTLSTMHSSQLFGYTVSGGLILKNSSTFSTKFP